MEISSDDIKEIKDLLYDLNLNMKVLMNYKFTDKMKLLEEKLITVKVLNVNQVMTLLDTSRNHALDLMERLAKRKPFFKFYKGSRELQSPGRIVYIEEQMLKNDSDKLWDIIPDTGVPISVAKIAEYSGLNLSIYIDYLINLLHTFADKFPDTFEMVGDNSIRKIPKSIKS